MATDRDLEFYAQHYADIKRWVSIEERATGLLRDATSRGDADAVLALFAGDSGAEDVNFYVRNRALIAEWAGLQIPAGLAMHESLLQAATEAGLRTHQGTNGWTTVRGAAMGSAFPDAHLWVELAWMRRDLLSLRRGTPFPRLAFGADAPPWIDEDRKWLSQASREVASKLSMPGRGDEWWVHWGNLPSIQEDQEFADYATSCLMTLATYEDEFISELTPQLQARPVPH